MLTIDELLLFEKDELLEVSKSISEEDLNMLIDCLSEKNDKIRYPALLILQNRSVFLNDIYSYWDVFCQKLKSKNSYQRNIGLILIAENAKWDVEDRLKDDINNYLLLVNDEKPITIRACLQYLCKIVPYKDNLHQIISDKLMSIDILHVRETMRKLVLTDILMVLVLIRKNKTTDKIENYIFKALTGGILNKKAIKQIESML